MSHVRGDGMGVFIRVSKHCCVSLFCSHPGSSAVTCSISSFWIRSRGRRTSLKSKPIASKVWRCSFFISSELDSRVKAAYNAITYPFFFHFQISRSTGGHNGKNLGIFYWFINHTFYLLRWFLCSRTQQ